jgi:hypothetical protein
MTTEILINGLMSLIGKLPSEAIISETRKGKETRVCAFCGNVQPNDEDAKQTHKVVCLVSRVNKFLTWAKKGQTAWEKGEASLIEKHNKEMSQMAAKHFRKERELEDKIRQKEDTIRDLVSPRAVASKVSRKKLLLNPEHFRTLQDDFDIRGLREWACSPLILVEVSGRIRYAWPRLEKDKLVEDWKEGDVLLFAWQGQHHTDVFVVSEEDRKRYIAHKAGIGVNQYATYSESVSNNRGFNY